jgi:hypothetical protein
LAASTTRGAASFSNTPLVGTATRGLTSTAASRGRSSGATADCHAGHQPRASMRQTERQPCHTRRLYRRSSSSANWFLRAKGAGLPLHRPSYHRGLGDRQPLREDSVAFEVATRPRARWQP